MSQDVLRKEIIAARNRSRGILLVILMALVALALAWYFMAPSNGIALIEADKTEIESLSSYEPFYVLLVGSDSRKGTSLYTGNAWEEGQDVVKADVLTLVRVDPGQRILTFLTIPRDTIATNGVTKINALFKEDDPSTLISEVEKITGVAIPYYVLVSFNGFEELINAIGGIQVSVPTTVTMINPTTGKDVRVQAGPNQELDGAEALAVASAWDYSNELESLRQMCVRSIERAIIDRVSEGDEDFIRRVVTVFNSCIETNLEDSLLVSLALDYAKNKEAYTIYAGSGPFQGELNNEDVWVIDYDEETWDLCMEVVDAGGDPNTVVVSLVSGASN